MGRTAKVQMNERAEKDRAHALALKGKFDEAIRIYRALLAQRDDAALYQSLGDVCRKRGLLDEAVKAYFSAAKQLEAQGHLPRARAALAVALQLAPGEPKLVAALNAMRTPAPVVTPPLPDRVKRHLALVPPPVAEVSEVSDDDILDSGEPVATPVITAQRPQRGGAMREATPLSAGSLLDELLAGVPEAKEPPKPALPPEIAAIFAAPPRPAPKHRSVDDLLALPPKPRTGSNPRLHRPRANAPIPPDIAAIFSQPVAPAPERRRNTRPPPPVPSLLGNDDDVLDSGFEHILDHVFSSDDTERTDPFCPRWPEQSSSRETVVARPRGKAQAKPKAKPRVPAYPR